MNEEIENLDFFLTGIKDDKIIVKHPVSKEAFDDVFFYIYKSIADEYDTLEKETIDRFNYLAKKHKLSIVNLTKLLKTTEKEIERVLSSKTYVKVSSMLSFHLSLFISSFYTE